jgi:hypothetical protein
MTFIQKEELIQLIMKPEMPGLRVLILVQAALTAVILQLAI